MHDEIVIMSGEYRKYTISGYYLVYNYKRLRSMTGREVDVLSLYLSMKVNYC